MNPRRGALVLLSVCACADDPAGALDPATVSALATAVGDAQGIAPSGVYSVQLTPEECGCGDLAPTLWPLTVCQGQTLGLPSDDDIQTSFDVVVSDGVISFASEAATSNPIGALHADGAFDAGAVTRLTSLATTGHHISRIDGELLPDGDTDYTLEGRLRLRMIGELELVGLDGVATGIEDIDCTETLSLRGSRYIIR